MHRFPIGLLLVFSTLPAWCSDPTEGTDRFPQFRNLSGLSGAGYGLDLMGYPSSSGAVALSTPVGPVLGHGRFQFGGGRLTFAGDPQDLFGESSRTNGTFFGTYGFTVGRANVSVSQMILSESLDQATNLQIQYANSPGARFTGSLGVQDVTGTGGSSGFALPGDSRSSRSVFGVLTYAIGSPERLVYVSAGAGTRRFRQGFASLSVPVGRSTRGWIEHDGFWFNSGMTVTGSPIRVGRDVRPNATVSFVGMRYFFASLGLGF